VEPALHRLHLYSAIATLRMLVQLVYTPHQQSQRKDLFLKQSRLDGHISAVLTSLFQGHLEAGRKRERAQGLNSA
jgi:hypothetical protein